MGSIVASIDAAQAIIHPEIVAPGQERQRSGAGSDSRAPDQVSYPDQDGRNALIAARSLASLALPGREQIKQRSRKRSKRHAPTTAEAQRFAAVVRAFDALPCPRPRERAAYVDRGVRPSARVGGSSAYRGPRSRMMQDMVTSSGGTPSSSNSRAADAPQPDQARGRDCSVRSMVAMDRGKGDGRGKVADDLKGSSYNRVPPRSPPRRPVARCVDAAPLIASQKAMAESMMAGIKAREERSPVGQQFRMARGYRVDTNQTPRRPPHGRDLSLPGQIGRACRFITRISRFSGRQTGAPGQYLSWIALLRRGSLGH